jgi:hypothetical protein
VLDRGIWSEPEIECGGYHNWIGSDTVDIQTKRTNQDATRQPNEKTWRLRASWEHLVGQ